MHPFARDIAGDRWRLALAGQFIDLVDVDDATARALDIVVGGLKQVDEDVFDVLSDVARLGQRGCVGNGERNIQNAGERLRQQCLARARGPDEQDVGLLQLDIVVRRRLLFGVALHTLVVVVDGDRERFLRSVLTDDILVQDRLDLRWLRNLEGSVLLAVFVLFLGDDVIAQADALIADVDSRPGDQLFHLFLRLSAERTGEVSAVSVLSFGSVRHWTPT